MFRGRRLVYVRQSLILSRQHAEQTTHKYSIRMSEEHWLYAWMIYNMKADDLVGSGLKDMYHFYSAALTKWLYQANGQHSNQFAIQKIMELPESPDADARAQSFSHLINDNNFEIYLPKEQETLIRLDFAWRGVELSGNVKFIPFAQFANVKSEKNLQLLTRDSLLQVLIDTPIRKKIFAQWLQQQGGQRA